MPSRRREIVKMTIEQRKVSGRLTRQAFRISETCYRHQPKRSEENAESADWLVSLTQAYRTWGVGLSVLPAQRQGLWLEW